LNGVTESVAGLDILRIVEYNEAMRLLFLSNKKGLSFLSGELELPVMEILWKKGPMKGRDLHAEIRLEKDIAYTTTLTVLDRLSKKGFIKKARNSGLIIFSPEISQEAYKNALTEDLIQKAFEVSPDLAVSAFADLLLRMDQEDVDKLERLIQERKNGGIKQD